METPYIEEVMSDDEIFMGEVTIIEIKKMFCKRRKHQESEKTQAVNSKKYSNLSPKLIRTHSQPNLRVKTEDSPVFTSKPGSPALDRLSDDSFIRMENMASNRCLSPKHAPAIVTPQVTKKSDLKRSTNTSKSVTKKPFTEFVKPKTTIIKTPANKNKLSTPNSRTKNAYQHIKSPIAAYIQNSPQTPLVQTVYPKKPLPSTSSKYFSIPNLIQTPKETKIYPSLPQVAYKSAKTTKVVQIPDEDKLPQSKWVKKAIPRPTVMKHEKRVINLDKTEFLSDQEDSFNMTCKQAEISHCTQKSAFKSTKKD